MWWSLHSIHLICMSTMYNRGGQIGANEPIVAHTGISCGSGLSCDKYNGWSATRSCLGMQSIWIITTMRTHTTHMIGCMARSLANLVDLVRDLLNWVLLHLAISPENTSYICEGVFCNTWMHWHAEPLPSCNNYITYIAIADPSSIFNVELLELYA